MRKLNLFILLIVLSLMGCSKNGNHNQEPDNHNDPSPVHDSITYQQTNNGLQSLRNIALHEVGVFVKILFPNSSAVIAFYNEQNNQFNIIHNNPTVPCSIEQPKSCSSYVTNLYGQSSLFYYNQRLYLIQEGISSIDDTVTHKLLQMNLDGSDHRTVLTLQQPENYLLSQTQAVPSVYFHRGYLYYSYGEDFIKKHDATTFKEAEFVPYLDKAKHMIPYFKEDKAYVMVGDYYDEQRYQNIFIEDGTGYQIIDEKVWVFALTDHGYIYWDVAANEDNTYNFYHRSFQGDTSSFLGLGPALVLTYKDRIILDQHFSPWIDDKKILLLSLEGDVLDEITSRENIIFTGGHLLTDHRFYTYWRNQDNDMIFGYIEIINDQFQEPVEIAVVGRYG